MASPIVVTGLEPSGGGGPFSAGWQLVDQKVYGQLPRGTLAHGERAGYTAIQFLGTDIWNSVGIDNIFNAATQKGFHVVYISLWRNPPTVPVGTDSYIGISVYAA